MFIIFSRPNRGRGYAMSIAIDGVQNVATDALVLRLSSTVCKAKTTFSQTVCIKASQCSLNVHLFNSSLAAAFWRCFLKEPKYRNQKYSLNPNPENMFSAKLDLNLPPHHLALLNKQTNQIRYDRNIIPQFVTMTFCLLFFRINAFSDNLLQKGTARVWNILPG